MRGRQQRHGTGRAAVGWRGESAAPSGPGRSHPRGSAPTPATLGQVDEGEVIALVRLNDVTGGNDMLSATQDHVRV